MRVPKWVIAVLVVPAAMASLALTGSKSVRDLPSYVYDRMVAFQSGDRDEMSFLHEPNA